MGQAALFVGEPDEVVEERRRALREERRAQAPRLVEPDRKQITLRPHDVDALLPPTHRARSVWAVVERLDVRRFYEPIKERAATAETVNADLKTWRRLDRFLVRGTRKVTCVLLWNVLAYNTLRWLALTAAS